MQSQLDGVVVAAYGRRGLVEIAGGERQRYVIKGRALQVYCGDRVACQLRPGSTDLLVTQVGPRGNTLSRSGRHGQSRETLATNLTCLLVVCAPRPPPDPFLLDRYLCSAELMGCRTILIWNKCDLEPEPGPTIRAYESLGYPLLRVSTRSGAGLTELRQVLAVQVGALVGQSGVGKSSLINVLAPDAAAAIGALSSASDTGTHTTTAVLMYTVADGRLLDTPGVRDFVPALLADERLADGFVEIRREAGHCRFADCRHASEPDCAVKSAVAANRINARRYESYRRLLQTVSGGTV
jgi:ribosome biogenesis GTPase